MRRYQRQQHPSPLRAQPWGCLLLVVLACAGCRSAAMVHCNACAADAAGAQAAANGTGTTAAGPGYFWKFCHIRRVPELGPTLSPFLPVPTVDVFTGMPVGVKPVAVVVPGSIPTLGSPDGFHSSSPASPPPTVPPPIVPPPTVPPPALLPQAYPPATNASRPIDVPPSDLEAEAARRMPVQLASGEASAADPMETPAEAAPLNFSGASTLRIRKESLRAEAADLN